MSDALQDSEKVDLEDVQKPSTVTVDQEPDEETLAQVEREEEEKERKRLEAQRRLFEVMVSPAVINQLDPNSLQLGGKRVRDVASALDDVG